MKRASFTVHMKNGMNYDANHLSIEKTCIDGRTKSILSFLCSGLRSTVKPNDVKEITFSDDSADWCSECDSKIDKIY
jgi:hypothetical protein